MQDMDKGGAASRLPVVLIVGCRCSGKSLLLHHLEASGYRSVDNLPASLIGDYLAVTAGKEGEGKCLVALALKLGPGEAEALPALRQRLADSGYPSLLVFLTASDSILRERGAAAQPSESPQEEAARRDDERAALSALRDGADLVIDSSYASPTEERDRVIALAEGERRRIRTRVELSSFGFKYGAPSGDLVLDVRFIPNPYYVAALRPLTGRDKACADYVLGNESAKAALSALLSLVEAMAPAYEQQGKPALRVRIGCTGGQHRSVAMVEALASALAARGLEVSVRHRELQSAAARAAT